MTPASASGIERSGQLDASEFSGVQSLREQAAAPPVRAYLLPEEQAVSIPLQFAEPEKTSALLNRWLGPALTVDNPAWRGNPIPRMRALQKKLLEHSLSMPEGDRMPCMDAIRQVEIAVQLRLRWQQMELSDAESEFQADPQPEGENRNETSRAA